MSFYDQSPQFGFTGSSMPGLPTTLDDINPAYYDQISKFVAANGGRLASICGVELYDTLRVDPGVLPTRDFVFFQNAVGSQQGLFVTPSTTYVKQEIDVQPWLTNGGMLSKGYEALIWSLGVQFHIVGALDDSVQTSGNAIDLTLDPGALNTEGTADPIKMGNLLRAFQEGTYFKLFVNTTAFEDGPGWRFPAGPYGGSGFEAMCTSSSDLTFAQNDGYINNGFGWSCQFPVMRHLPELTKFGVRMSVQNPFTTANVGNVRVVVTLGGIGVQPVTG
jgi:hypothetical protein